MAIEKFSLQTARDLDQIDPLAAVRERFQLPDDVVYLDGNSLGPLPRSTPIVLDNVIQREWGQDLIRSWNDNDWIGSPQRIGGKIARLLVPDPTKAPAEDVIVSDSVSVNLFKLLTALVRRFPDRKTILSESHNFPTDVHVAQGVADAFGLSLQLVSRDEIVDHLDREVAVLLLTHVHYRTGQRYDMAAVNAAAATVDVPVLWDLSHSIGAVPLDLSAAGTQFAVGCGYKFLNGGPGAPGFVYVESSQQDCLRPLLQGWLGHNSPFGFEDEYQPAAGLRRFLVGTPPILSLLALESGLDVTNDVDREELWEKSCRLFDFFCGAVRQECSEMMILTPEVPADRGSQVSLMHPHAWPINNALIERGIIGDFRSPNVLRFGLTPLYTRYEEIWQAVTGLSEILKTEEWKRPDFSRDTLVT